MDRLKDIFEITVNTAGGTETLDGKTPKHVVVDGSGTLTNDYEIEANGAAFPFEDGNPIKVFYNAAINTDGFSLKIFGRELTKAQAANGGLVFTFTPQAGVPGNGQVDQFDMELWRTSFGTTGNDMNQDVTLDADLADKIQVFDVGDVTDDRVVDLIPRAGKQSSFKLVLLGGKVDSGFTWSVEHSGSPLVTLEAGTILPTIYDFLWTDAGYKVERRFIEVNGGHTQNFNKNVMLMPVEYDFAVHGGAQGTINLGKFFPHGSIILADQAFVEVETVFASAGAAEVSWGLDSSGVDALSQAEPIANAPYDGADKVEYSLNGALQKLTSLEEATITISVADLTAGKARIYVPFIVNKH